MALYVYARVSTFDQDLTIQEQALRVADCDVIRAETASGAHRTGRAELETLMRSLRSGGVVRTPLQIEQHVTLAFEHGFRCGEKPVAAELLEIILRLFLRGALDAERTRKLSEQMRVAGLPL
jgi:hypothetical protein